MNSHRYSKCNQIIMDNLITLFHYKIELSTKIIGQFPIFPLWKLFFFMQILSISSTFFSFFILHYYSFFTRFILPIP